MASYDYINAKSYVLEAGAYEIKLMNNAHDVIETETINIASTITYQGENKRSTDLSAATNQFDGDGVNFLNGHTYLSRNDWEGTWPQASYAPNGALRCGAGRSKRRLQRRISTEQRPPARPLCGYPHYYGSQTDC